MSMYRITHKFVRLEALGAYGINGRVNDPADPLALEVRITPSDDISDVVESGSFGGYSQNKPFRLTTGLWAFDLTPELYEDGRQYTVHFRYEMTPENLKVDRHNFVWNKPLVMPTLDDHCVVHGTVLGINKAPMPSVAVILEQYKDYVTLNHRTGSLDLTTDAFGNWHVELPHNELYRALVGNYTKVFKVPVQHRLALKDASDFQPADVRKDKYGYPLP